MIGNPQAPEMLGRILDALLIGIVLIVPASVVYALIMFWP